LGSVYHYWASVGAFGALTVGLVLEVIVDTIEFYAKTGVRFKLLCNAGFFMVIQSVSTIFATAGFFLMLGGTISTHIKIKYRGPITAKDIFFDMGELMVFGFLTFAGSMLGIRILRRSQKEEPWPEGAEIGEKLKEKDGNAEYGKEMENIHVEQEFVKEDPWK
jgi:hypothetical protein